MTIDLESAPRRQHVSARPAVEPRGIIEEISWRRDLRAAFAGWACGRILTLLAFGLASRLAPVLGRSTLRLEQEFMAWDGDRYLQIARDGYSGVPVSGRRYFPLFPILGRTLASISGLPLQIALIAISSAAALLAGMLVHRLALLEFADEALARRASWIVALSPASFVLGLGYTEGLAIALSAAAFLSFRRGGWARAGLWGAAAALARPTGVLLALPAAFQAAGRWRTLGTGQRWLALSAATGPIAGCALYLWWIGSRFGNPFQPFTIQQSRFHRGAAIDPISSLARALGDLARADFSLNAARAPWAVGMVVLMIVCLRRLPRPYGIHAAASVILMLGTQRWGSLERYSLATVPLVLGAAVLIRKPVATRILAVLSLLAMFGYAVASFLGVLVP